MTCSIEGCENPMKAKGLCSAHWQRQRNGRPMEPPVRGYRVDGIPSYNGAHRRLSGQRGRAAEYQCVDCDQQAAHWSLIADSDILVDSWSAEQGSLYSLDPFDYEPRCVACHFAYDKRHGLTQAHERIYA